MAKRVLINIVVTSPEKHNLKSDCHFVWSNNKMISLGNLGFVAQWLCKNVEDDMIICFKGFGPIQATTSGRLFRIEGLDVLLKCLSSE